MATREARLRRFAEGKEFIKERMGVLTKDIYDGTFHIQCEHGHQFILNLYSLRQGDWCPDCGEKFENIWYTAMKERVEKKGGKMLSKPEEYVNAHSIMTVLCANGHKFKISLNNQRHDKWCPVCKLYLGEAIMIQSLRVYTGKSFVKVRPKWLQHLELDAYSEELKLAFEYQGQQHYKFTPPFHKTNDDLEKLQSRDELKKQLCKGQGVTLLEISYLVAQKDISKIVLDMLKSQGIEVNENAEVSVDDIVAASNNRTKILSIIAEKEGKLETEDFIPCDTVKFEVRCKEGHVFSTNLRYLRRGTWCPDCRRGITESTKAKISAAIKQHRRENPKPFTPRGRTPRDPDIKEKTCKGSCDKVKDITSFNKKEDTADGYQPWCHDCVNAAKKKSREKNKSIEFTCEVCEKKFALKDSLTRHMKEKHAIQPERKRRRVNAE